MDISAERTTESDATNVDFLRKPWSRPCIVSLCVSDTASADTGGDIEVDFFGIFIIGNCGEGGNCISF